MLIYQITLPQDQDADAFIGFMRDSYIPAVRKGPTRVGQVTSLALLRSAKAEDEFFLHVGWSGLPRDGAGNGDWRDLPGVDGPDEEQLERTLGSFGIKVHNLGTYNQVAAWSHD